MPCTCDKMGAPWVAKDAVAVIIIILTMVLKIGHGATLHQAALSSSISLMFVIIQAINCPISRIIDG